ncbi:hypothetical protein JW868_00880 [Candidatus Woesearchaeota archaeon]|nr:hypothetical protein [Candidatus Woesearchaeota archaeon]
MSRLPEYIASAYGSLQKQLKTLKSWEEVELADLRTARAYEQKIAKEELELGELRDKLTEESKKSGKIFRQKTRQFVPPGGINDEKFQAELRKRFGHLFVNIDRLNSEVDAKTQCIQELEAKMDLSINGMFEHLRFLKNASFHLLTKITELRKVIGRNVLDDLRTLARECVDFADQMTDKLGALNRYLQGTRQSSGFNDIKKDVQAILDFVGLADEQTILNEIELVKHELNVLKHEDKKVQYTNVIAIEGRQVEVFVSKRAAKTLENDYYLQDQIRSMASQMFLQGIGLIQRNTPNADFNPNESWRLVAPGIIRHHVGKDARVLYTVRNNRIIIGDVFPAGEHNKGYDAAATRIRNRTYVCEADQPLMVFPVAA